MIWPGGEPPDGTNNKKLTDLRWKFIKLRFKEKIKKNTFDREKE